MNRDASLDVEFCRRHFPALDGEWVFMENAGGTLVPQQVIDRTVDFMTNCQVQPGEGYAPSAEGADRFVEGPDILAAIINADQPS